VEHGLGIVNTNVIKRIVLGFIFVFAFYISIQYLGKSSDPDQFQPE
jgi:hypothetical protein